MKKLLIVFLLCFSAYGALYHWKYAGVTDSLLCETNWSPNWTVKDPTDSLEIGDSSTNTFKLYPGKSFRIKQFRRTSNHTGTFNLLGDYQTTLLDACTTEVFIDSGTTGSSNYPPNMVFDGTACRWITSASNGTLYAASTTVRFTNNSKLNARFFKQVSVRGVAMDTGIKITYDSGSATGDGLWISGGLSPMLIALHNDTINNNCYKGLNFNPVLNQKIISSPNRTLVFIGSGASGSHITAGADNKTDTLGFYRSQQTTNPNWSSQINAYNFTMVVLDSVINPASGAATITNASAPNKTVKWKWLTGSVFQNGAFNSGSLDASGNFVNVFNGVTMKINSWISYATGPLVDSMQNLTVYDTGLFKYAASNHSVYITTYNLYLVGSTGTRIQPYGKPVGWLSINKTSSAWDSLSSSDSLIVLDTMRIDGGKFRNGTSPASPLLIKKGLVVGSTDSCWFNARVADSGDAFFGSGLILTWAANIPLQMVGTSGTQKLTTTGNIIPLIIHKNAGILQPQDSLNCNNILDSSSGTFDQDFGTRCTTAVFSGSDSIAMSGNMEIVKNLSFGLQAKENVTGSIKWIGSGAAICADSGTQLADVIIAKTAGQAWSSAGVLKTADFTGTTGDITIGAAATDTAYSVDVVLNNANVTVNAPWYVSGNFSCAGSTVFAFSPSGKIVMTNCVAATLNGNSVRIYYPTISPISYAASPWIDTIGKTATHAITITGCSLGKDSITNITAFPTGYSINKTTGLISWNGSGSQQSAASYTIRAYANAKTDSASVNISIEIYNPVKGKLSGLNTGLIIGTD